MDLGDGVPSLLPGADALFHPGIDSDDIDDLGMQNKQTARSTYRKGDRLGTTSICKAKGCARHTRTERCDFPTILEARVTSRVPFLEREEVCCFEFSDELRDSLGCNPLDARHSCYAFVVTEIFDVSIGVNVQPIAVRMHVEQ